MTAVADGTALYRIRGEAALLLYIGISDDFGRRWMEHAKRQPWWAEMRSLSVDRWYETRAEAEIAEEAAIRAENPKYNERLALPAQQRRVPVYGASLGFLGFADDDGRPGSSRPWVPGWALWPEAHDLVRDGVLHPCGVATRTYPQPCAQCPVRANCAYRPVISA